MRRINAAQKVYYEVADGGRTNEANGLATNLYRAFRARAFAGIPFAQYRARERALHKRWIGDPSGMKVLDLGCGSGNPLSIWLARRSADYTAIDLSESKIRALRKKLPKKRQVRAIAGDFLDTGFDDEGFDLVYALAVFHHFRHLDDFLHYLHAKMKPGGIIVTKDPLQTWLPARMLRTIYRPFQTDRDWEYPFTRASLNAISRHFETVESQGMMRSSKWAMLAGLASPSFGARMGERAIEREFQRDRSLDRLGGCLQVSMKLRARQP